MTEQKYMCVNCGGGFTIDKMVFNSGYDCDFCVDCYPEDKESEATDESICK
tara:strand:+ start:250 stop:402 length:153 start_codon:yes stop_codon:yes gene_type:complete